VSAAEPLLVADIRPDAGILPKQESRYKRFTEISPLAISETKKIGSFTLPGIEKLIPPKPNPHLRRNPTIGGGEQDTGLDGSQEVRKESGMGGEGKGRKQNSGWPKTGSMNGEGWRCWSERKGDSLARRILEEANRCSFL
jgi:hypothetical protein